MESVLCMDVKPDSAAEALRSKLTLQTQFYCGRETNTSTRQSEYLPLRYCQTQGMMPTIGPSVVMKEMKREGVQSKSDHESKA